MTSSATPPAKSKIFKPIALVVLAVLIGAGIGLLRLEQERRKLRLTSQLDIKILSPRHLLSPELQEEFEKKTGNKMVLTEVESSEDVLTRMSDSSFDVAIIFENQINQALQSGLIQPAGSISALFLQNVSPDFTDFLGRPNSKSVLPILWGMSGYAQPASATTEPPLCGTWLQNAKMDRNRVLGLPNSTREIERFAECAAARNAGSPGAFNSNSFNSNNADLNRWVAKIQFGASELSPSELLESATPPALIVTSHGSMAFAPLKNWKFSPQPEGSELWILEAAVTTAAKNPKAISELFDFLGSREAGKVLVEFTHQASPNRLLDGEALDPRLKASYLRQIPLTQYRLRPESPRALEIRKYLQLVAHKTSDKK